MPRIEQKQIKGTGNTAISLNVIRQQFEKSLGEYPACTFLVLNQWLQAPVSDTGKSDCECEKRAKDLAPLLNRHTEAAYSPSSGLSSTIGKPFQEKWDLVDESLKKGRISIIKGAAEQIGGQDSVFKHGHHVVLFLSTGAEERTRKCYVGFDPDISATKESQNLWDKLVKDNETENKKVKNLESAQLYHMVRTMILGEGASGVGPLIRKYYPDREKGLDKIQRFL